MAVEAGCDIPLSWGIPSKEAYQTLLDGYRDGMITDEQLEISVSRVLEAQHKVTLLPKNTKILPEDVENVARINRECISAVCAEGYTHTVDPDGKHLFVIMTDGTVELDKISEMPTATAAEVLKRIKGVGDKVAACSLLFGFNKLDAFPVDVWIKKVIARYFGEEFTSASLGPYAGVA
jgi:endonuclease III